MYNKHIVLITSGQPATNPRLVKEADCLMANGYRVTVLYCYWNKWATLADATMMRGRKWKIIRVGGHPRESPLTYLLTKAILKLTLNISKAFFQNSLQIYALSRATFPLARAAKQICADLYLAHNLAALPAAIQAAKQHKAMAGFDAEDYHREETASNASDFSAQLKVMLEDKYIPQLDYFTTSSSTIADLYKSHYQYQPMVLRNLLPVEPRPLEKQLPDGPKTLKLFWFSQTIGPNRGIELIVESLKYLKTPRYELHLLGEPRPGYLKQIVDLTATHGIPTTKLHFHPPVPPKRLFQYCCKFDIGLASEPAYCTNNDAALSNKLFTYIQAGLVVLLSDTKAQQAFYDQYPQIGKCYKKDNAAHLAQAIQYYIDYDAELQHTKRANFLLGQHTLNWEQESQQFINKIKQTIK
jgi:glycosyltransferase involved in cell wall biosynthesis